NLAPALVALGVRYGTVSYAKGPRYDGRSRVGPVGLVREALPSLALTGAATALLTWTAVAVGLGSLLLPIPFPARMAGGLIAAALAAAGFEVRRRARAVLARASQPHEPGRGPTGGGG
ncbi:MAG TPA: hypothetical protein PKA64_09170, partial [Myxococcota bacterium]|nr:hypothetical protein [Myxococcota bacterium]